MGGIRLGGVSSETARSVVNRRFDRALRITYGDDSWTVRPAALGGSAAVDRAVAQALQAGPGTDVELPTAVSTRDVRTYVRRLDRKYSTDPEDARFVRVQGVKPVITEGKAGVRVATGADGGADRECATSSLSPTYRTIGLATKLVAQQITRANFGSVIVISREPNRLLSLPRTEAVHQFGVATGQAVYPTPLGKFQIVVNGRTRGGTRRTRRGRRARSPSRRGRATRSARAGWASGAAASASTARRSPARSATRPRTAASGCTIPQAEWLFEHVDVGTPVAIVSA